MNQKVKKSVTFSETVTVFHTFAPEEYNRRASDMVYLTKRESIEFLHFKNQLNAEIAMQQLESQVDQFQDITLQQTQETIQWNLDYMYNQSLKSIDQITEIDQVTESIVVV